MLCSSNKKLDQNEANRPSNQTIIYAGQYGISGSMGENRARGLDPKEMLCVGDAVSEIRPAKKLGTRVIGVLTGFSSKEDMESASISTIGDLAELVEILN